MDIKTETAETGKLNPDNTENSYMGEIPEYQTRLPEKFTINNIAEILGQKAPTVRKVVEDMEKEKLLSTSNKEANKHRSLLYDDFDKIRKVFEQSAESGLPYKTVIQNMVASEKTGVMFNVSDIFSQGVNNSRKLEEISNMFKLMNQNINAQTEVILSQIKEDRNEEKALIMAQAEEIKQLKDMVNTCVTTLEEIKAGQQPEEKPKKNRKFFGIFSK